MTEFNPFGGSNVKLGVEEFLDAPEASYAIFKNGIFKRSKESTGVFTIKVQDPPPYDLGLTQNCSVSYQRNEDIPKIPYSVFHSIFKFYKGVFNTIKSEVYSMVFWDKKKKDFFIHIPKQKVSFASVSYEKDPELFGNPNFVPFFESHSHSSMKSFFSGTDLKDEQDARIFAVFGEVDKDVPDFVVRAAYRGQAQNLSYEDVFDVTKEKLYPDSDYSVNLQEALTLIEEKKTYGTGSKAIAASHKKTNYDFYYEDTSYYSVTQNSYIPLIQSSAIFDYDYKQVLKDSVYSPDSVQNFADSFLSLILDQYPDENPSNIVQDITKGFQRCIDDRKESVA